MNENELNKILIEADSSPSGNDIIKKHTNEMNKFKEELFKYMDEYQNNDIDMSFDDWINIKFKELLEE